MNSNQFITFTNARSYLAYKFHSMRAGAQRERILAKLTGKDTLLQTFPVGIERKNPNRKLLPVQEIPIEKIVGTLNRRDDFDYKFRPLKKVNCDRWVNTHLTLSQEGWQPILVHKIGSEYFIEDGHHRVSVAHQLGIDYIQAKVWEYPVVEVVKINTCPGLKYGAEKTIKLYVSG